MTTTTIDRPKYKSVTTLKRYRVQGLTEDQWLTMGSDLLTKEYAKYQIEKYNAIIPTTIFRIKEIITVTTETEVNHD